MVGCKANMNKPIFIFLILITAFTGCTTPKTATRATCRMPYDACYGRYGDTCYNSAKGEECYKGLVCQGDEQVCDRNNRARCIQTQKGDTCP